MSDFVWLLALPVVGVLLGLIGHFTALVVEGLFE